MKSQYIGVATAIAMTMAGWVMAGTNPATAPAAGAATQPSADDSGLVIAYQGDPPAAGTVTTRLESEGGRCISDPSIQEYVLCSPTLGLTTSARPKLVWYLNKPIDLPVRILLSDVKKHLTVHLWTSSGLVPAGIHALDLSPRTDELQKNVQYKWTVHIVNDPSDPSKDMYSSGTIERIDASDADAVHHAFYDSMGTVVTAMASTGSAGDARHDQATAAFSRLLELSDLPSVRNMTVTVDSAKD